ncbi:hypothetical protein M885DRAFT_558983 [Pelagophyceae sp. CCMP2097]|nr:hypothetical protein M885DRAFT_558983 [Pelagophyceae sp. CCMP2097]
MRRRWGSEAPSAFYAATFVRCFSVLPDGRCGVDAAPAPLLGAAAKRSVASLAHKRFLSLGKPKSEVDFARVLELYEYPTPERIQTKNQRRRFSEFSNETLAVMASQGVHGAFKERLLREIMRVDECSYIEAYGVLSQMNKQLEQYVWLFKMPYQLGIASAWVVGIVLVPMGVFHLDTAIWFNTAFVHSEQPPLDDLDTAWKVGTWTWSWMEPLIGTASFILLAMQLMRANMLMIDLKPFHAHVLTWRANRLYTSFPHYEREIIRDYAKSDPWGRDTFRVRLGFPANSVIPLGGGRA